MTVNEKHKNKSGNPDKDYSKKKKSTQVDEEQPEQFEEQRSQKLRMKAQPFDKKTSIKRNP